MDSDNPVPRTIELKATIQIMIKYVDKNSIGYKKTIGTI